MPLFPHGAAVWAPAIAILAVIGIIYGALVAFAQDDVKKLVAYSSVSHLGLLRARHLRADRARASTGSIYAMLSHGLTTGGLFLGIGVLYERRHTRRLAEYGGIWKQMPVFAGLFLIIAMGSAGLPALSGFVGEFLTHLRHVQRRRHVPRRPRALPADAAPARRARGDRRDPRRRLPAVHVPEGVLRQARQGEERQAARPERRASSSCSSRSSLGIFVARPVPAAAAERRWSRRVQKFIQSTPAQRRRAPIGPPHIVRPAAATSSATADGRRHGRTDCAAATPRAREVPSDASTLPTSAGSSRT